MTDARAANTNDGIILPVLAEELRIEKREVATGTVAVTTHVDETPTTLRDAVTRFEVTVERVDIDRAVDVALSVRTEGDITIVPVVEERLEIVRRLHLVEEIRLHRSAVVELVELHTTRRTIRAVVERTSDQPLNNEQVDPTHG